MPTFKLDGYRPDYGPETFVAPGAQVIGRVSLGARASIWFNAVVRGDDDEISIGDSSNVQDGAVVHADPGIPTRIGNGVTVGHQAIVHGATVGENSLIGMGASLLNRSVIGANSIVGAHALVTEGKVFPDGSLIVGAPAKLVRPLTEEEIAGLREATTAYVAKAARYLAGLEEAD
jgi:carbonic anhydrase/acetyltransferase-like protein (isoleucine patch superfamily)